MTASIPYENTDAEVEEPLRESMPLGPCGWPYTMTHDISFVRVGEYNPFVEKLVHTNERTFFSDVDGNFHIQIIGCSEGKIRLILAEVSNNVWIIASNDAPIYTDETLYDARTKS